ncbi:hypothetical protein [Lysinibacillus pakistanensis]
MENDLDAENLISIRIAGHVTMLDQKELFNEALFDIIDQIKH